jgi:hypothetical protein
VRVTFGSWSLVAVGGLVECGLEILDLAALAVPPEQADGEFEGFGGEEDLPEDGRVAEEKPGDAVGGQEEEGAVEEAAKGGVGEALSVHVGYSWTGMGP